MRDDRRLVYSSDHGWRIPERTGKAPVSAQKSQIPDDGVIRVSRQRRRASTTTVITGLNAGELQTTAKLLKTLCATGGTAKNGIVELQGDHRDKVLGFFEKHRRRAIRAGG